jgi:ABC-2 type transport system permease protein
VTADTDTPPSTGGRCAAPAPSDPRPVVGSLRAVLVIAQRDLSKKARHPATMLSQAVQLLFFVVVYGVGFDGMVEPVAGIGFGAYVYPGIVAIQVVTVGLTSGMSYAWDREFGVLRELLVAPVPRICLPVGKVVATTGIVTVQSAVLLAFCPLVGLPLTQWSFAGATLVFAGSAVLFATMGLLLAIAVTRVQTVQAVVQLAMFPMLFLSGSVFRPDGVPVWMQVLIQLNPVTYAVDLVRQVLLGPAIPGLAFAPAWADVAVLAGLTLALGTAVRLRVGR